MDEEKTRLHMEVEKYREKCNHEREKCIEAQSKYNTVQDQLRRVQEREETNTQKLLNSSANIEAVSKSKVRGNAQKLLNSSETGQQLSQHRGRQQI
jgi:cysteinyl-tRNA synthetase